MWGLGVQESEAELYDVYVFDEELLEMVPKPLLAVIFFPVSLACPGDDCISCCSYQHIFITCLLILRHSSCCLLKLFLKLEYSTVRFS